MHHSSRRHARVEHTRAGSPEDRHSDSEFFDEEDLRDERLCQGYCEPRKPTHSRTEERHEASMGAYANNTFVDHREGERKKRKIPLTDQIERALYDMRNPNCPFSSGTSPYNMADHIQQLVEQHIFNLMRQIEAELITRDGVAVHLKVPISTTLQSKLSEKFIHGPDETPRETESDSSPNSSPRQIFNAYPYTQGYPDPGDYIYHCPNPANVHGHQQHHAPPPMLHKRSNTKISSHPVPPHNLQKHSEHGAKKAPNAKFDYNAMDIPELLESPSATADNKELLYRNFNVLNYRFAIIEDRFRSLFEGLEKFRADYTNSLRNPENASAAQEYSFDDLGKHIKSESTIGIRSKKPRVRIDDQADWDAVKKQLKAKERARYVLQKHSLMQDHELGSSEEERYENQYLQLYKHELMQHEKYLEKQKQYRQKQRNKQLQQQQEAQPHHKRRNEEVECKPKHHKLGNRSPHHEDWQRNLYREQVDREIRRRIRKEARLRRRYERLLQEREELVEQHRVNQEEERIVKIMKQHEKRKMRRNERRLRKAAEAEEAERRKQAEMTNETEAAKQADIDDGEKVSEEEEAKKVKPSSSKHVRVTEPVVEPTQKAPGQKDKEKSPRRGVQYLRVQDEVLPKLKTADLKRQKLLARLRNNTDKYGRQRPIKSASLYKIVSTQHTDLFYEQRQYLANMLGYPKSKTTLKLNENVLRENLCSIPTACYQSLVKMSKKMKRVRK